MLFSAYKYSVLGRSVLIVDTSDIRDIGNINLQALAMRLSDSDFGVGSALVTFMYVLEFYADLPQTAFFHLDQIRAFLSENTVDRAIVCRTFLPSGHELFSCSEAYCAIVEHLNRTIGRTNARILDDTTFNSPSLHYAFRDISESICTVDVGNPSCLPSYFVNKLYQDIASPVSEMAYLDVLTMQIRLENKSDVEPIVFFAVALGEPYLICFVDNSLSDQYRNRSLYGIFNRSIGIQDKLLKNIVELINGITDEEWPFYAPQSIISTPFTAFNSDQGINVVFAQVSEPNSIDVRFYTRGTFREVRFQGEGAVAASLIAQKLGKCVQLPVQVLSQFNVSSGYLQIATVNYSNSTWWITAPVITIWQGHVDI